MFHSITLHESIQTTRGLFVLGSVVTCQIVAVRLRRLDDEVTELLVLSSKSLFSIILLSF